MKKIIIPITIISMLLGVTGCSSTDTQVPKEEVSQVENIEQVNKSDEGSTKFTEEEKKAMDKLTITMVWKDVFDFISIQNKIMASADQDGKLMVKNAQSIINGKAKEEVDNKFEISATCTNEGGAIMSSIKNLYDNYIYVLDAISIGSVTQSTTDMLADVMDNIQNVDKMVTNFE